MLWIAAIIRYHVSSNGRGFTDHKSIYFCSVFC